MPSITPAQFKMIIDQNDGDEEAARAQVEQQGMTVEGDAASDLSARPDMAALKDILASQRQSIGTLYDTITQNIQKRYRAPDINDLLISIGTGMMSAPQEGDNSGFAGAVQRGIRGLGPYAQSRRTYENDMNQMMSNVDIQKAKDLASLEEKYATGAASLLKPRTPTRNWSENLQQYVSPDAPSPTQVVVATKSGLSLTQYTDGSLRFNNPDGSQDVYDPATGRKIGTTPAKGTM